MLDYTRYVDYEEFVYICETSNPKVKIKPLMVAKKDSRARAEMAETSCFATELGEC